MLRAMRRSCPFCDARLKDLVSLSGDPFYECPEHGQFVVVRSSEDSFWDASKKNQRLALRMARSKGESPPVVIIRG